MAVTATQIRIAVETEDDFAFEMRVGHVMRQIAGAQVQHGGTYKDAVTGKPRQFDYRCSLRKEIDGPKYRKTEILSLAVESKNLNPNAPLVICRARRRDHEAFHDLVQAHLGRFESKKHHFTAIGHSSITKRATSQDCAYAPGEFVGKSLVRLKPNQKNVLTTAPDADVYDRWAQALSSSIENSKLASKNREQGIPCVISAILPVVVVPDGSLWTMDYEDDGAITGDPRQAAEVQFYVTQTIGVGHWRLPHKFTVSHIHFFTLSGFSDFLSSTTTDRNWQNIFTEKAVEI